MDDLEVEAAELRDEVRVLGRDNEEAMRAIASLEGENATLRDRLADLADEVARLGADRDRLVGIGADLLATCAARMALAIGALMQPAGARARP